MIFGPNFIFLHVPKTGGTWLERAFEVGKIPTRRFQKHSTHFPLGYLPEGKLERLPAYALVRNPWDWYVSHYEYVRQKVIPNLSWNFANKQYALMFRTLRSCIEEMPPLQHELASLTEHPTVQTEVLRYEDGLLNAYQKITKKPPNPSVKNLDRLNVSPHPHYREYYDENLRWEVYEKNSALVHRFCYRFYSESATE